MKYTLPVIVPVILFLCTPALNPKTEIYQNYITIYGEGPIGRHPIGFDVKTYSMEDSVNFARTEILEFLSGMVYGYRFVYKTSNKLNNRKGYFEAVPIFKIQKKDPGLRLRQYLKSQTALKFQAVYRLSESQKNYLSGWQSLKAKAEAGKYTGNDGIEWTNRIDTYYKALENAVLNGARKKYKSRPQYIKGRLLLKESPDINLIDGQWRVIVKVHLELENVSYQESY